MAFYDLTKAERNDVVAGINENLMAELMKGQLQKYVQYFADEDTYIRKAAYLAIGRIYFSHNDLRQIIIQSLDKLILNENFKVRQTVINAAGEIGKYDFKMVQHFFDAGLFDPHHSPRNAVIGSVKKMSEVNPVDVLAWAKTYLHHPDKEIRRQICHGIELRGRKFPLDILPLLQELQFDKTPRVRKTLIHVLGQIAYKKGCLKIVIGHLKRWEDKQLVAGALDEIIDVHRRYRNFAALTQTEAKKLIDEYHHTDDEA